MGSREIFPFFLVVISLIRWTEGRQEMLDGIRRSGVIETNFYRIRRKLHEESTKKLYKERLHVICHPSITFGNSSNIYFNYAPFAFSFYVVVAEDGEKSTEEIYGPFVKRFRLWASLDERNKIKWTEFLRDSVSANSFSYRRWIIFWAFHSKSESFNLTFSA